MAKEGGRGLFFMTEKKIEKICVNNLINGWKKTAVAALATPASATTQKRNEKYIEKKCQTYIETNGTFFLYLDFMCICGKVISLEAQSVKYPLHFSFSFFSDNRQIYTMATATAASVASVEAAPPAPTTVSLILRLKYCL